MFDAIAYQIYNAGASANQRLFTMTNKHTYSKFKKILLLGYERQDFGKKEWIELDGLCVSKVLLPKESPRLDMSLKDADCLLINQGMVADGNMMDIGSNLRYIGILATGYNRIDTAKAKLKHITVCNVPGYATESVAEFVFASLLEHMREIERAKQHARGGDYSEVTFNGAHIKDKTLGIIGLGRIGQRVAQMGSQGFGAKVLYWSRKRKKDIERNGISYKSAEKILKESDIITTHLSYAKETLKFFNKKRISMIKPGAIFVNFAPMELIDLKALEERLKKKNMTFIMDHPDEMSPKDMKRLSKYKNCIIYPPIGFKTSEASILKKRIFINNLQNFLKGTPVNKVN